MVKALATIMHAIVVSNKTDRIALIIAVVMNLEVKSADILNVYEQTPVPEKVGTILSPKFGCDPSKTAVFVIALYGLKSAGAAFRSHPSRCIESMGYLPC